MVSDLHRSIKTPVAAEAAAAELVPPSVHSAGANAHLGRHLHPVASAVDFQAKLDLQTLCTNDAFRNLPPYRLLHDVSCKTASCAARFSKGRGVMEALLSNHQLTQSKKSVVCLPKISCSYFKTSAEPSSLPCTRMMKRSGVRRCEWAAAAI